MKSSILCRLSPVTPALVSLVTLLLCTSGQSATLDVTKYGAIPDDPGDATAGIQTAMSAAKEGDEVYLPAGTYRISKSLVPVKNTKVYGAGVGKTVLLSVGPAAHSLISMGNTAGIEITQLTLDGGGAQGLATDGIRAEICDHLYIHDLAIQNLGPSPHVGNGVSLSQKVTDSRFENCTFTNIGVDNRWSSAFRISHGSSRNTVIGNTVANTGRGGILCNDGSNDLVIQRNTITGSGGENLGIELWGGVPCDRAIVEDNIIDHWLSISGSNYCAVRRNKVSANDGVTACTGIECVATHDSIFTDNAFAGGATDGISISAGPEKYDFFAYNDITDSALWGIQVQGDHGGASNLYFYKDTYRQTRRGPRTPLDTGYGFRINGNTHFLTLDSVTITNNPSWAIQGIGVGSNVDALSVVNCTITNNASAFSWAGKMANLEWANNTVSGNKNDSTPSPTGFLQQKPVAVISGPSTAVVGQPVTFTSASTSSDGTIAHTLWDFGAGAPVATASGSVAYTRPGKYRVSLLVWDEAGRGAHAESTISVEGGQVAR